MDSIFLNLIVVYNQFFKIVEITTTQEVLKALISYFIVTECMDFKIRNKLSIGKILSACRGQIVVIKEQLLKIRHIACFCKEKHTLVSNIISR